MTVLFALLIAHALCDYPLQNDFLSKAKNHTALGCLACACGSPEWRNVRYVLCKGFDHAAAVSQKKAEDRDFSYLGGRRDDAG